MNSWIMEKSRHVDVLQEVDFLEIKIGDYRVSKPGFLLEHITASYHVQGVQSLAQGPEYQLSLP